jgi:hypothetical protein
LPIFKFLASAIEPSSNWSSGRTSTNLGPEALNRSICKRGHCLARPSGHELLLGAAVTVGWTVL